MFGTPLVATLLSFGGLGAAFWAARRRLGKSEQQQPQPIDLVILQRSTTGNLSHAYDPRTGEEYVYTHVDRMGGMIPADTAVTARWWGNMGGGVCDPDRAIFESIYEPHARPYLADAPTKDDMKRRFRCNKVIVEELKHNIKSQ